MHISRILIMLLASEESLEKGQLHRKLGLVSLLNKALGLTCSFRYPT